MKETTEDGKRTQGFCSHGNKPPCEICKRESTPELADLETNSLSIESRKRALAETYPNNIDPYREVPARNGEIKNVAEKNPYNESGVRTDTAVIFEGTREVASGIFYGCGALFLFDGKRTLLAHMTPGNRLQYLGFQVDKEKPVDRQYVDDSLERILQAAREAGMNLSEITFLLVAEPGITHQNPNDTQINKYSIESTEESFKHIERFLTEHDVRNGEIVRSTVSDFTVIYSPEEGGVYVTGYKNEYVNGVLRQSNKKEDVQTNFFPVRL